MLVSHGANILATKPDGRNFADEAIGSNKALAEWWCKDSGLQQSGIPKESRSDMWQREGVSEKRYARFTQRHGLAACSQNDEWWEDELAVE